MRKPMMSAVAVLILSVSTLVSSGCGIKVSTPQCRPPAFTVTPNTVKPGDTVKVQADDATCDPKYGQNAQVQVWFVDASDIPREPQLGPMNSRGGFELDLKIPLTAIPGQANVSALPYNFDCGDGESSDGEGGKSQNLGGAVASASCGSILVPLTIAK